MDLDDLLKSIREEGKGGKIVPAKFLGEDRYEKYKEELAAQGSIGGEQLTPQERKEGFKKRNDKIGFEKFINKVLAKKKSATVAPTGSRGLPRSGAIVKAPGGAMQKFIQSPVGESTEKIVEEINQKLDDLIATIREEQKLEGKSLEKERVSAERDKRSKAENKLESGFTVLKKSAEKILKPVKGIFDKIFGFIKKIILGNVLMKIIDWFADDENQGKIKTIFRFIEDFWPALTAAVLLFGTSFGGIVRGLIGTVVKLTVGLVKLIPRFAKFFMTPLGAAMGLGALAAGGAFVASQQNEKRRSELDAEDDDSVVTPTETREEGQTPGASQLMQESILQRGMGGGFNKGGFVGGGGPNSDTVPAMLSPGEFVMSRGAVQRYGTSTLESMNSMGGGTNVPVINQSFTTYAKGGGMMPYSTVNNANKSQLQKRSKEQKKLTHTVKAPKMPNMMGPILAMDPILGLSGGGGGTNALTEQSKVGSIGAVLGDMFGAFKKKEIDPQNILFDEGDLYQDNRVMMSPGQQRSKKNMSVSQDQIQRTPIGPPTKPKPQVEFLPLGSGGANGQSAQVAPTESQIPAFSASTSGSGNKMQTLGIG